MRQGIYLLGIVVLLILGVAVVVTHQENRGFSVVYFDNLTVPNYLSPGNNTTVIFVIESHEDTAVTYSFEVSLDGIQVENGSVSLTPGESVQVPVNISIANVTYMKVVLWNKTTSYNISGALNVTGGCIAVNSTGSWTCLPAAYKGPSDLNFMVGAGKNFSVVEVSTNSTNTGKVSIERELKVFRVGEDYRIVLRESKVVYMPKDVVLEVTVRASNGKVYRLSRSFPVAGGRAWNG